MAQRIAGIFNVVIDGSQYAAEGEFNYTLSGITQEAYLASDGAIAGYKGTPVAGGVEGTLYDTGASTNIEKLIGLTGEGLILLSLANGVKIKLSEAAWAGDNQGTTDGKFTVKFIGNCERI